MAKFSNTKTIKNNLNRVPFETVAPTFTYEGGEGFVRDAKSEFFLLAVSNMVGENTFYEEASDRDERFRNLIHKVTQDDPKWMQNFIPFLREKMFMRSASTVTAAEYIRAGGPNGRSVVNSALQRPDEPGEILGYWINDRKYSKAGNLPAALKRGVSDAVKRLFNEKSALKYDGLSRGWRMADVLNVVHPKPSAEWQNELFKYLIDRRFDREINLHNLLPIICNWITLNNIPKEERRNLLKTPEIFSMAGMTWESLSGWLGGPMDAKAWKAIIPSMGYMALLRNLRNFDGADISRGSISYVMSKLSDPDEIKRSKQFPYRFLSAWLNTGSIRWADTLGAALDLSTQNIPSLGGSTIIYTDTSASMDSSVSTRSKMTKAQAAALFAVALAKKGEDITLIQYASDWAERSVRKSDSILRKVEQLIALSGEVGHGTNTWQAVDATYSGQDRVIIFTDMQAFDYGYKDDMLKKITCPIYSFNLSGYSSSHLENKGKNFEFGGGLSDATFSILSLLETVGHASWPWENK